LGGTNASGWRKSCGSAWDWNIFWFVPFGL
jgi:hypothetical protein